jgi:hypothetical protein
LAISTYSELKAAIASRADRIDLTSLIPDFIAGAETRITYGSKEPMLQSEPLRIRAMEASDDLTINGRAVAIPSRVIQARRIYLNTDPIAKLELVSPDKLWGSNLAGSSGQPVAFCLEGENYVFGPAPDATYTGKLLSYKSFEALSDDAPTNWLLTNAPSAYVQGALIDLWDHLMDEERRQRAFANFCAVINGLNAANQTDRFSGSPWVGRSDTDTP